jgi:hypothetical protein
VKEKKMKRVLLIILAVVAVFLVIGFAFGGIGTQRGQRFLNTSGVSPFGYGGGGAPDMAATQPMAAVVAPEEAGRASIEKDAAQQGTQERMVIENADLAIVIEDPEARMAEIGNLAKEMGGFVVSSSFYQDTSTGRELPQGNIVIRVPSERLDEALTEIKKGALDVPRENRSGEDVTNQYVDLQAQLKAKQAAEEKLLEIMDQATRAEDVLAIYLQVQNVQTEIERLKGQIQYLEESAALSAISVQLMTEESNQPIEIGPWRPEGAAREAIQNLIFFFQNFVDFLITLVLQILPSLILIAIPLYLVYLGGRAAYRRFSRSKVEVEETKSEEIKG